MTENGKMDLCSVVASYRNLPAIRSASHIDETFSNAALRFLLHFASLYFLTQTNPSCQ